MNYVVEKLTSNESNCRKFVNVKTDYGTCDSIQ